MQCKSLYAPIWRPSNWISFCASNNYDKDEEISTSVCFAQFPFSLLCEYCFGDLETVFDRRDQERPKLDMSLHKMEVVSHDQLAVSQRNIEIAPRWFMLHLSSHWPTGLVYVRFSCSGLTACPNFGCRRIPTRACAAQLFEQQFMRISTDSSAAKAEVYFGSCFSEPFSTWYISQIEWRSSQTSELWRKPAPVGRPRSWQMLARPCWDCPRRGRRAQDALPEALRSRVRSAGGPSLRTIVPPGWDTFVLVVLCTKKEKRKEKRKSFSNEATPMSIEQQKYTTESRQGTGTRHPSMPVYVELVEVQSRRSWTNCCRLIFFYPWVKALCRLLLCV